MKTHFLCLMEVWDK